MVLVLGDGAAQIYLLEPNMNRDNRSRRDIHALDDNGNVLCNARDQEAAHRAEVGDIFIGEGTEEVTCRKCRSLLYKARKEAGTESGVSGSESEFPVDPIEAELATSLPFVRIGGATAMTAEYRSGDGVDPKEEKRLRDARWRREKSDHANDRLASQIFDALCLSSVLVNLGLEGFAFVSVHPLGGSGRFLVEIACQNPSLDYDDKEVRRRLQSARGSLRADVAAFIHRKKVPELLFEVQPRGL